MKKSETSKFDFYEKVIVETKDPEKARIRGKLGAVLGKSTGDNGNWFYAVSIYEEGITYFLSENEIISTGELDERETFYDGTSIRVSPDGKPLK
jgi:Immunity protein 31